MSKEWTETEKAELEARQAAAEIAGLPIPTPEDDE